MRQAVLVTHRHHAAQWIPEAGGSFTAPVGRRAAARGIFIDRFSSGSDARLDGADRRPGGRSPSCRAIFPARRVRTSPDDHAHPRAPVRARRAVLGAAASLVRRRSRTDRRPRRLRAPMPARRVRRPAPTTAAASRSSPSPSAAGTAGAAADEAVARRGGGRGPERLGEGGGAPSRARGRGREVPKSATASSARSRTRSRRSTAWRAWTPATPRRSAASSVGGTSPPAPWTSTRARPRWRRGREEERVPRRVGSDGGARRPARFRQVGAVENHGGVQEGRGGPGGSAGAVGDADSPSCTASRTCRRGCGRSRSRRRRTD